MSDHSANFRSALMGGFHRQDVLAYIENKTKTHTEELNELGRRLDTSQKELAASREELTRTAASLEELRAADAVRSEEYRIQCEELTHLRAAHEALRSASAGRDEELSALRAERDQLIRKMSEMQVQLADYEQAKLRVANIELEAYSRAKKIEDTAISNAEMARAALATLVCEAKRRFDQTRDDATRTICYISEELDRLRDGMKNLPGFFEIISGEIDALKFGSEKKADLGRSAAETAASHAEVVPANTEKPTNADVCVVSEYDEVVFPEGQSDSVSNDVVNTDSAAEDDDVHAADDTAEFAADMVAGFEVDSQIRIGSEDIAEPDTTSAADASESLDATESSPTDEYADD